MSRHRPRLSAETRQLLTQLRRHIRRVHDRKLAMLTRHYAHDVAALNYHGAITLELRDAEDAYALLAAHGSLSVLSESIRDIIDRIVSAAPATATEKSA